MPLRPRMRMPARRSVVRRRRPILLSRFRRFRSRITGGRVHSFTEKVQLQSIAVAGGTTVYGTQTYQIGSLTNWNSYALLFDLYKLKAVKLTLVGLANTSEVTLNNSALQSGALPMLYIAPNRDQYVPAPTSVADVINDDGAKVIRFSKPQNFYISNPKVALLDSATNAVPFQFNVGTQPWLTTGGNAQTIDQSLLKHYGHRYAITNNSSNDMVIQVYVKYYFEMKEQD